MMRIREIKESIIKEYSISKSTATNVENSDEFNFGFEIEALFQRIKNPDLEKYIDDATYKIPLNTSLKEFKNELFSVKKFINELILANVSKDRFYSELSVVEKLIYNPNIIKLYVGDNKKLSQNDKDLLVEMIRKDKEDSKEQADNSEYKKDIQNDKLDELSYNATEITNKFLLDKEYGTSYGHDLKRFLKDNGIDDSYRIFKILDNTLTITIEYFSNGYASTALKDKNDGGVLGRIAKTIENDTGIKFNQKDTSYKNYKIVEDESVKSNLYDGDVVTGEIVSPILSVKDGLKDLKVLFDWLSKNGAITNESTGFHVNLSIKGNPPLNKLKLIILFDEQKVLDEFDRNQNVYTLPQLRRLENAAKEVNPTGKTIKEIEEILSQHISMDKYSSINFLKYKYRGGHIEWRILGNKDYHQKYDIIKKRIIEMVFSMKVASTDLYEAEYKKKLMKLVKTID